MHKVLRANELPHSKARFNRTIERVSAEAFWLYTYQKAICGLCIDTIGLDFFRVSHNALNDALLIRLIRILEDKPRNASFWYLYRSNEKLLEKIAKASDFDLEWVKVISDKFVGIRNKTFVHIDKDGVFEPQKFYDEAAITHNDVDKVIMGLWKVMQALHLEVLRKEIQGDNYTGDDIKHLADLRDKELHNNSIQTDVNNTPLC